MNNLQFGFRAVRSAPLPELRATLHEMEHDKTGARLVWIERDEVNKTFGIAFPTLPQDDTGVFHILEHSVLCGSERYPVKEPFVELMKHSMNTFLNALTFPDKTLYPISSRNGKDFLTLMRVYLDAVFHPAINHTPEIFRQEGWRYEFDETGAPHYKGVVFNEMKGALADAGRLAGDALERALFPDTPYRYESGGDPAAIPDLTYERFLACHRKFYAPSNALIVLDGAVDLDAVLRILDEEYLGTAERSERTVFPPLQKPVDGGVQTVAYEVPTAAEEAGRTRLVYGYVLGSYADRETLAGARALAQVLAGDNESPLCRAVLAPGLAEDLVLEINDSVAQPWLQMEIRNLKAENAAAAEAAVLAELERLAVQGIDRQKLEAALARLEFEMRERDFGSYPAGVGFCMQVLDSWLYGGRPEANLEVGALFDALRQKLDTGWFEALLRRIFLDNAHRAKVVLTPSHTAGEARRRAEAERLAKESAAWTEADRAALRAAQAALDAWQKTPDSPEALAALSGTELADVDPAPAPLPLERCELAGLPVLLHRIDTAGIAYLTLYFDADGLDADALGALGYLCRLLGHLPTRRHTAEQLNDRIRLVCGDLQFQAAAYARPGETDRCRVRLAASVSALQPKLAQALDLVAEILTETDFSAEAAALDLLRQLRQQRRQHTLMAGHLAGFGRLTAQFAAVGAAQEYLTGFAAYEWVKNCEEHWDWAALRPQLEGLLATLAVRARLTLSVTAPDDAPARTAAAALAAALPAGTPGPGETVLAPWGPRREGIAIPADIAFACCGGNCLAGGRPYGGAWQLAAKLLGLEYLWNAVRVQGGAYGTGLAVRSSGLAACWSYRDPRAVQSLQSYAHCAGFLREFCREGRDLTGLIIGAVSDSEPLLTPRAQGLQADLCYWQGIDDALLARRRAELLGAGVQDLLALADTLETTLQSGVCVVGGRAQLEACGLDTIRSV